MYQINNNIYAIEEGDKITFVRDFPGGQLDVFVGDEQDMKDPNIGPRYHVEGERVELTIIPTIGL